MEFHFSYFSLFVVAILLPLIFLFLIKRDNIFIEKLERTKTKLPLGPPKLPIIGNLHQLLGTNTHRVLHDLACKHGPDLMHLRLGQVDHIIVSSCEAAKEIMNTHDLNFSSRPPIIATTIVCYNNTDIAFAPYGNYWRQLRKICTLELLSAKRVKASCALREEEAMNLVSDISTSSSVNLTRMLMGFSSSYISRSAFGAKCEQGERFMDAAKWAIKLSSGFNLADLFPSFPFLGAVTGISSRLKKAHLEIDEILGEIIEDHIGKRRATNSNIQEVVQLEEKEDLVDVLLRLQEEANLELPLTVTNIKAVILDMFTGGTETTSTLLEWIMAELMRHPDARKKAQAEVREVLKGTAKIKDEDLGKLHYMKLVIKETLRLHPPLPLLLPRLCGETCTVMGYRIPAGTKTVINAWSIGRDPKYWEDSESFKPERFDVCSADFAGGTFVYLPFGGGRRICPGMTFGVATVEVALALLLFYFDWELPAGMKPEDLDMSECFGATVSRKSDLCLLAKPHSCC